MQATETRATITAKYLPLLEAFRAKNDVRYYLNGFLIEPHEVSGVYLIATNGVQMAVVHDEEGQADGTMLVQPAATIARDAKKADTAHFDGITCELRIKKGDTNETEFLASAPAPLIDGKFPDWRSLMPIDNNFKSQPGMFDVKLLAALLKVPLGGRCKGVHAHIQPLGPSFFRFEKAPEILVLIMPIQTRELLPVRPDWLAGPAAVKQAA